jgi:hypothetical protein
MKHLTKSLLLAGALLVGFTSNSQAGPAKNWPWENPWMLKSKDAAEKVAVGTPVALACPDCKTATEQTVDDKKSFLGWFKKDLNHACAGCKGLVTLKALGGGKNTTPEYKHECSKCKSSPYTCVHKS